MPCYNPLVKQNQTDFDERQNFVLTLVQCTLQKSYTNSSDSSNN